MSDTVLYDVIDRVAVITLNRPERLNAWNPDMSFGYRDALDRATRDPDVRALVVTGAGRGFCSGMDLDVVQEIGEKGGRIETADRAPQEMEPAVPKPVIAAVNGACVGLGLARAMFCDVRVAAAGAKFSTAFAQRGLVAEFGLSWLLPRLLGMSRALDVLLSGRVVTAEEALRLGMVDRVVEDDVLGAALDYAREIATWCSPASLRDMKAQVWRDTTGTLGESWDRTALLMAESFDRPDILEGVASYRERRPPAFPPLT